MCLSDGPLYPSVVCSIEAHLIPLKITFQITRDKNLILESAPVIVTRPKNQIIDAGDTILLDCVANGEPPPTICM